MVRLSALGFALTTAFVLVPGVLSQVPACATSCESSAAAAAGCKETDLNCLCNSNAMTFGSDAGVCVKQTCTQAADYTAAVNYFGALCNGTSTVPSSAVSSASTTTGTTSTPSSKPNHAMREQPAGVLGAGLALGLVLALAVFA